jgi:peptide/nickel transport system permease protein
MNSSLRFQIPALLFRKVLTVVGVSLLVFYSLRLVPGDPVDLVLGESALPAKRAELRARLGLDLPHRVQLEKFTVGLARADLGNSYVLHRPVTTILKEHLPYTVVLAIIATLFASVVGIPLGAIWAGKPRSFFSRIMLSVTSIFSALPVFWLGPLLVIAFALRWPWLPVAAFREWTGIILPAATLGIGMSAALAQTTRAAVLECMNADYVRTAVAKGASFWRALFFHALPNSAVPILTVLTLQLGHLLAGAVITETIFDWPGLGKLIYDAILMRDYPTIQGATLFLAALYVVLNLLSDLVNSRFVK